MNCQASVVAGRMVHAAQTDTAEPDDGEEKKRPRGEVGYDAHLGGAIAGILWHVPSLLAVKRRR